MSTLQRNTLALRFAHMPSATAPGPQAAAHQQKTSCTKAHTFQELAADFNKLTEKGDLLCLRELYPLLEETAQKEKQDLNPFRNAMAQMFNQADGAHY